MHSSGPFGWVQKDENESFLFYGMMKMRMDGVFHSRPIKNHLPKSQIGRKSRGENVCYREFVILFILITIFFFYSLLIQ